RLIIILVSDLWQYCLVKVRDAINRRLYEKLILVETPIYRVFSRIFIEKPNRTVLEVIAKVEFNKQNAI
ncbi:MAG: hypothetical protein ACR2LR_10030, partial [Hassallia sp.]